MNGSFLSGQRPLPHTHVVCVQVCFYMLFVKEHDVERSGVYISILESLFFSFLKLNAKFILQVKVKAIQSILQSNSVPDSKVITRVKTHMPYFTLVTCRKCLKAFPALLFMYQIHA